MFPEIGEPLIDCEGAGIYLSGPMTGFADFNYPVFERAQGYLEGLGWKVFNPAGRGFVEGWDWLDYIIYSLQVLKVCDAVCVLPGFDKSPGAIVEVVSALRLRKPVFELHGSEFMGTGQVCEFSKPVKLSVTVPIFP